MAAVIKVGWWFVSTVDARTHNIILHHIDAVFAEGADDAMELAEHRNPLRPHQVFALQRIGAWDKRKAVRLNEVRTSQICEIYEIMRKVGIVVDLR
jgi:hypothetical protein